MPQHQMAMEPLVLGYSQFRKQAQLNGNMGDQQLPILPAFFQAVQQQAGEQPDQQQRLPANFG